MTQFCLLGILNSNGAKSVLAVNAHPSVKQTHLIKAEHYSLIMATPAADGFSIHEHYELIELLSQDMNFVPFYGAQYASKRVAQILLHAHKNLIETRHMRCATRRQITLSLRDIARPPLVRPRASGRQQKPKLLKLVKAIKYTPIKFYSEVIRGGNLLHLLYQNNLALRAFQELSSVSASHTGTNLIISKPISPVQFEGLKISFLSSSQITAAEFLMDISTQAPVEEIRHTVKQQLQLGLNNHRILSDDALQRQRSRAATLLTRIADAREALLKADVNCSVLEIPFIRSQTIPNFGAPVLAERDMLHSNVA